MSSFSIPSEHQDQIYIPAAPISARELALSLQNQFPGQIFAIMHQSGFAPRCIKLADSIRHKIHFGIVQILSSSEFAETELLIDGQFMRLTGNII